MNKKRSTQNASIDDYDAHKTHTFMLKFGINLIHINLEFAFIKNLID